MAGTVWEVVERSYERGDSSWVNGTPEPGLYVFTEQHYSVQARGHAHLLGGGRNEGHDASAGGVASNKKEAPRVVRPGGLLPAPERETGLEPATPTLARLCSTN